MFCWPLSTRTGRSIAPLTRLTRVSRPLILDPILAFAEVEVEVEGQRWTLTNPDPIRPVLSVTHSLSLPLNSAQTSPIVPQLCAFRLLEGSTTAA